MVRHDSTTEHKRNSNRYVYSHYDKEINSTSTGDTQHALRCQVGGQGRAGRV